MTAEKYRRYAAECLELMRIRSDARSGTVLLTMAAAWTKLAEQAEKNKRNDVIYEPPMNRAAEPRLQQQQHQAGEDDATSGDPPADCTSASEEVCFPWRSKAKPCP